MKILALDCSTKTGWALLDENGRIIESGVQSFDKRRGESNGLVFLRFRSWLSKLIEFLPGGVGLLVYERAHMRGGAATELCVGMQTRVQEAAAERQIESLPVPSTTLKKWATGNGRAGKLEMIQACRQHLGRPPEDDNEADAVLLAVYAHAEYGNGG
jgi:Holliday junction resolvasome RuvABC endonuclease subunit